MQADTGELASAAASLGKKSWGTALKRMQSAGSAKIDGSTFSRGVESDRESAHGAPPSVKPLPRIPSPDIEEAVRRLGQLTQRLQEIPLNDLDAAYDEYAKIQTQGSELCQTLVQQHLRRPRSSKSATNSIATLQRNLYHDSRKASVVLDSQPPFRAKSQIEVIGQDVEQTVQQMDEPWWLTAIRDWKTSLESLVEAFEDYLAERYKTYETDGKLEMVDSHLKSQEQRPSTARKTKIASFMKVMSTKPDLLPTYDVRFRNYDSLKQDLAEIRHLLHCGESGISPDRTIIDYDISPRGDAILEFGNVAAESVPALRFRVSSYMLAETSPIFARMFTGHSAIELVNDEGMSDELPLSWSPFTCKDDSEARLYRMPQLELNREHALEILLHAAHMHNDKVPREVNFEQFVAIADVCMRYRCTSPLELHVEHKWLSRWMHKATEDMPDGFLVISYVFGIRHLFTRMSKTAILNIVDEKELQGKPWPQKMKDKIWAVRCAKMAQVHACCSNIIQEYLRPPQVDIDEGESSAESDSNSLDAKTRSPSPVLSQNSSPRQKLVLSSTPRCPKGSHWCDATNLGWLMLIYSELQLLPTIMRPTMLSHLASQQQPPRRSLAQIVDTLRTAPSPPQLVHKGGVCDPAPAFRTAINDIYNSVSGLTLYDISGRAHGWALSRHRAEEPQAVLQRNLRRWATTERKITVLPEAVRLRILAEIDNFDDLHSANLISRDFYEVYKKNELMLIRNIVRSDRRRTLERLLEAGENGGRREGEDKVLKIEAEGLKTKGADGSKIKGVDVAAFKSFMDEDSEEDDHDHEDDDDNDVYLDAEAVSSQLDEPAESSTALTEAEAERILWPEQPPLSIPVSSDFPTVPHQPPGTEVTKEKFLANDPAFAEEKTLARIDNKQLRVDHDERLGLLHDGIGQ